MVRYGCGIVVSGVLLLKGSHLLLPALLCLMQHGASPLESFLSSASQTTLLLTGLRLVVTLSKETVFVSMGMLLHFVITCMTLFQLLLVS